MSTTSDEHWLQNHWRPACAWIYGVINVFDFILFPILTYVFAYYTGTPPTMWAPLTLQGSGLFHVAFGSIITATSWGRTKEKLGQQTNQENSQPAK